MYIANKKPKNGDQIYTPLFIDLVDDYNQFEYFVAMRADINQTNPNVNINSDDYIVPPEFPDPYIPTPYPLDNVCLPPTLVESFVFGNTSITAIKNAIVQYLQEHPEVEGIHSVEQLFYNYGY